MEDLLLLCPNEFNVELWPGRSTCEQASLKHAEFFRGSALCSPLPPNEHFSIPVVNRADAIGLIDLALKFLLQAVDPISRAWRTNADDEHGRLVYIEILLLI